jgi:pSer/pThr/pTyr-binding forkhead associated (FHA) protein
MTAKLILSMDGLVLKEILLNKERMSIGRKPHNDIQIDNLAISGEHAAIMTILDDSFLEDLNSTNGTIVNGQQIKKHFLQNSDVIELGKYKLKFLCEKPLPEEGSDFEKTMIVRPNAMKVSDLLPPQMPDFSSYASRPAAPAASPVAPTPAPTPAPAPAPAPAALLGALQILTGGNAGKSVDLVKSLTTMGKPGVQVAVITRRPQGYFITHVEGVQFPIVNGVKLGAQPQPLSDHDIVEIAGVKMEFFIKS